MKSQKNSILSAQSLCKSYRLNDENVSILHDLSLDVPAGAHVSITGSSGSGKSTLLTLLAALDTPDSGKILFDGKDITQFSETQIAQLRRHDFGFVFQSFHLIPSLTALENVMFPLELLGKSPADAQKEAIEMLEKVNLAHRKDNFPHQLSGGEKQRVAISRALIHKPKILFADEPTGNLDDENSKQVLDILLQLQKEFGTTLIVVTHEADVAALADTSFVLNNGVL